MNDPKREAIRLVVDRLEAIKEEYESIKNEMEWFVDDEQDTLDNLFPNHKHYESIEEACEHLQNAFDSGDIEEMIDELEQAIECR